MQSDSFSDVTGATVSFVVAFVVGTALMILCRILFPFTPVANLSLGSMLSTAVAVVVLILYGWYACRKSPRWETMARTGDDLYYLGLLFTLVSLIYSLIVLFILRAPGDAVSLDGSSCTACRLRAVGSSEATHPANGWALMWTMAPFRFRLLDRIPIRAAGPRHPRTILRASRAACAPRCVEQRMP